MAHGLSCPAACGIFPDQESNSCLLHWQVDSLPLSHHEALECIFFPSIFFFFSFSVGCMPWQLLAISRREILVTKVLKWWAPKLLLFSSSVESDSLWPCGLQHTRLPCPSPSSGVCSNSCPLSQRCHPTISSSVILFSSCLQSFPASESFPMSQFFTLGGQSIGASTAASVLPMNIQDWFLLGLTGLTSL